MTDLWGDIKNSLGEWATKAADKAGELTREAADKAEEVTKLGKVKLDIFQIKRDIEKQFAELGGMVYQLILDKKTKDFEKNETVKSCLTVIQDLEKKLKEKEKLYKTIQKTSQAKKEQSTETDVKDKKE